jgi:hypothetical protein
MNEELPIKVQCPVRQGEGTSASDRDPSIDPVGGSDDFAHFYRFTELLAGKRIDPATGAFFDPPRVVEWPAVLDMVQDVPPDGWVGSSGEPDLAEFDSVYTVMPKHLHNAWAKDNLDPSKQHPDYKAAVASMRTLTLLGTALTGKEITPGSGTTFCPRFRGVW